MQTKSRKKFAGGGYSWYRLKSLLSTYLIACLVFYAANRGWVVSDVQDFLYTLISFNTPGAAYYIIVYTQLILISPLLYVLVKKCMQLRYPLVGLIFLLNGSLCIGYMLTIKGIQFPYYGGAKYLLCGSYLALFVFGMLWEATNIPQKILYLKLGNLFAPVCALFALVSCIDVGWTTKFFSLWEINPPGIKLMLYAGSVVWLIASLVLFTEKYKWVVKLLWCPIAMIGRYSLDIFLFHNVVYALAAMYLPTVITGILRSILLFTLPIIIPIVGRKGYSELKKWIIHNIRNNI